MATPSVYINLEDDVSKIVTRLKHQSAKQVVLVCPKRCFLFSDAVNLKLLKKQADLMGKEVSILTMDEKGQLYARQAGFGLKSLPKSGGSSSFSDVKTHPNFKVHSAAAVPQPKTGEDIFAGTVREIKHIAQKFIPAAIAGPGEQPKTPVYKIKAEEPKVTVSDTVFPAVTPREESLGGQAKKSYTSRMVTGLVAVSLILVLLLVFVVLPTAAVVVYPKTEPVTRDMEISMGTNVTSLDPTELTMPATAVNETMSVSGKFQSQGQMQVGNKATGTVKIYNFTREPLNLKATTTTLSAGGNTYSLVNDVSSLRPTTYSNARTKEVDPSSLGDSVDIIANQGGDASNLPAGTRLEITNQVFGSRPQILYAITDSEITGGTTRYLSIISQDDVTAAQTQLQSQILQQVRQKLQEQGLVLADKAYVIASPQFTTDSPVGAETPSFGATLSAQVSGLAFKGSDLSSLIEQRIGQTLASNKTLEPSDPDQTTYQAQSLDLNNQVAVLAVHYQGEAVFSVDLPDIAPELTGKTKSQVNEILSSKAEVASVQITLGPVWQKTFPLFASKIKVSVGQPQTQ